MRICKSTPQQPTMPNAEATNLTKLEDPEMADQLMKGAAAKLKHVLDCCGGLLVLTGAGMSVSSGVPVFRNSVSSTHVLWFLKHRRNSHLHSYCRMDQCRPISSAFWVTTTLRGSFTECSPQTTGSAFLCRKCSERRPRRRHGRTGGRAHATLLFRLVQWGIFTARCPPVSTCLIPPYDVLGGACCVH